LPEKTFEQIENAALAHARCTLATRSEAVIALSSSPPPPPTIDSRAAVPTRVRNLCLEVRKGSAADGSHPLADPAGFPGEGYQSESAFDYFASTVSYLGRYGTPTAFYSDKHSVFRVHQEGSTGRAGGVSQFGRALAALNIDIICANSPHAKGRVERMNKTLEDRLVKELRLRGISSMEAGNVYLQQGEDPAPVANLHLAVGAHHDSQPGRCTSGGSRT
jgi:hypothetical protein